MLAGPGGGEHRNTTLKCRRCRAVVVGAGAGRPGVDRGLFLMSAGRERRSNTGVKQHTHRKGHPVPISVQVSFKGIDVSDAVEKAVRVHAAELGRYYRRITHCDVVIDAPHRHHQKGGGYSVRVDLTVPGEAIVVSRRSEREHAPEDISSTLGDAFKAARRRLEDYVRRRRGFVKQHRAAGPGAAPRVSARGG